MKKRILTLTAVLFAVAVGVLGVVLLTPAHPAHAEAATIQNGTIFSYGDTKTDLVAFNKNGYTVADFNRAFGNPDGTFYLPASVNETAIADPFLLTKFEIKNKEMSWEGYDAYFKFAFRSSNIQYYLFFLYDDYGRASLQFYGSGMSTLWSTPFSKFVRKPNGSTIYDNTYSFGLEVVGSKVKYTLSNDRDISASDFLPNITAYQPDTRESKYFLPFGATTAAPIEIYTDTLFSSHEYWGGFLGLVKYTVTKKFSAYPSIVISGQHAEVKKAVNVYIGGSLAFIAQMPKNHYEKPIVPPAYEREGYTVRWYLDAGFTRDLLREHCARDFNALYGKYVPAEYDVTLVYYTLDRIFLPTDGGLYYEALVKKSVTRTYLKDATINLNDFGTSYYGALFYNNIQRISFTEWDGDIAAPVSGDTTITAQYTFPVATIRYFDVDDKLYGELTQPMTIFPADLLKEELDRLALVDPMWWKADRPESDGAVGVVYRFFESIMRWLFGGDNVGNGVNAQIREEQKDKAKQLVYELARKHTPTNQYFLPVVYLDINLEYLNKGAYGNAAFKVYEEKNPQWHLVSGDPLRNDLMYFADVHSMYSLATSNFTLVVNFDKKMDGFDAFAQKAASFFGFIGSFFGGIFKAFGTGLGWTFFVLIGVILLCIFCFPLVVAFAKALFSIIIFPFRWLAKKLEART